MVNVYRADGFGIRRDFVAGFKTKEEAERFVATHPEDFVGTIPVIN